MTPAKFEATTPTTAPVVARTEEELIAEVRRADAAGVPIRIVGRAATANTAAAGVRTIEVATRGLSVNDDGCAEGTLAYCGGVLVTVAAGEEWPGFVEQAVAQEWVGVERLAGYRGSVGGATISNAHGYGQSVADTAAAVRTYDRVSGELRRFAMVDCHFTAGGSRFASERMPDGSGRYVLLDVSFLFRQGDRTAPIRDPALARLLRVERGARPPLAQALAVTRTGRASSGVSVDATNDPGEGA